MFSNTAYEALYQYIGLSLHGKFIEIITSQSIFLAAMMLIFGSVFFLTTIQFFARYLPHSVLRRKYVPLSAYFKIVLALFIGISLLKVDSSTSVKQFNGRAWSENSYIQGKLGSVEEHQKVSFLFDLLSRSAEEIARLIGRTIDDLFSASHSQLDAPNFFFKAILYSGTVTIDDPAVASGVDFYIDQCFDRVVPLIAENEGLSLWDKFLGRSPDVEGKLGDVVVPLADGTETTCLDIKNRVLSDLAAYGRSKGDYIGYLRDQEMRNPALAYFHRDQLENLTTSQLLVNHFYEAREGFLGIQKGAQLPASGPAGWIQYASRLFSWDGFVNFFTPWGSEGFGASLAARRAQEFSENLTRAPHLAGAVKMILILVFPWLVFVIVAGYWKVLAYWFAAYFSVLLWTPLWTLFYHIMIGVSQSAEQMEAFRTLSDGISLYSAELILRRMNYMFAVFSWIQILVGLVLSGTILFSIRPLLTDTEADHAPEFVGDATNTAFRARALGGMV